MYQAPITPIPLKADAALLISQHQNQKKQPGGQEQKIISNDFTLLDLSNSSLTNDLFGNISMNPFRDLINYFPKLSILVLNGVKCIGTGVRTSLLTTVFCVKGLQEVDLRNCQLQDAHLKWLGDTLASNTTLITIRLEGNNFSPVAINTFLTTLLNQGNLTILNIDFGKHEIDSKEDKESAYLHAATTPSSKLDRSIRNENDPPVILNKNLLIQINWRNERCEQYDKDQKDVVELLTRIEKDLAEIEVTKRKWESDREKFLTLPVISENYRYITIRGEVAISRIRGAVNTIINGTINELLVLPYPNEARAKEFFLQCKKRILAILKTIHKVLLKQYKQELIDAISDISSLKETKNQLQNSLTTTQQYRIDNNMMLAMHLLSEVFPRIFNGYW